MGDADLYRRARYPVKVGSTKLNRTKEQVWSLGRVCYKRLQLSGAVGTAGVQAVQTALRGWRKGCSVAVGFVVSLLRKQTKNGRHGRNTSCTAA